MADEPEPILDWLKSVERACEAAQEEQRKGNSTAAEFFWNYSIAKSRQAVRALVELSGRGPAVTGPLSTEEIRRIEAAHGIEAGTFETTLRHHQEQTRRIHPHLVLTELEKDLAEAEPGDRVSALIRPLVRIGSAVVIGALVGAPLAALAVQESVVDEMIKAGITTGLASVVMEITNAALEKPPEPEIRPDLSFLDPVDLLAPDPDLEPGKLKPLPPPQPADHLEQPKPPRLGRDPFDL